MKFSAVGCGIGLVIVAFGFILPATIFGKIVGVVVLIFCLTVVAVSVWGFIRGNDRLVIVEDNVSFEGKKITEIINLVGYGIKPDRLGEVADIIGESLKRRMRP